jgi:very-short-patch-repair endonuclease
MAAVLALGKNAALSHLSAAALWDLLPDRGPRIDVTVPSHGGRKRRRLIVVHRARMTADEVTLFDAIPVTTPARTLLDVADVVRQRQLERAFDQAEYLGLDVSELTPRKGRRGYGRVCRILDDHEAGSTWTRSELEERMLALCRRQGLALPEVNSEPLGFEVDFAWPAQRLAVETDGWAAHRTRGAFERDRLRDAALVEAHWRVIRITRRRLAREPAEVAALIGRLLAAPQR